MWNNWVQNLKIEIDSIFNFGIKEMNIFLYYLKKEAFVYQLLFQKLLQYATSHQNDYCSSD